MLTPTVTEEEALWLYIGELPECRNRRGQVADWYQDREGEVECPECSLVQWKPCPWCKATGFKALGQRCQQCGGVGSRRRKTAANCYKCDGTGRVSNGNAEMAEALQATADRVPWFSDNLRWSWWLTFADGTKPDHLDERLFDAMENGVMEAVTRSGDRPLYCVYFAAHVAIRDLCRAWVKVHKGVML